MSYRLAQKELKSYFSSPIAYIVIGLWALLYGYFFVAILNFFVRQSMQMNQFGMQGPQAMNVNQQLIRCGCRQGRAESEKGRSVTLDSPLMCPIV